MYILPAFAISVKKTTSRYTDTMPAGRQDPDDTDVTYAKFICDISLIFVLS